MKPQAHVLIVDDEPINIQILAAALGAEYRLSFATSAARARSLLADEPPDLLLLDVQMPEQSGFELLKWLKSEPLLSALPVIFVTSRNAIDDEEQGLLLGAVDYVTKPISAPIVRARVATHVALKRHRDLLERSSLIDGLTGVANRRAFDREYELRWRKLERNATGFGLVLLDVDQFKLYNDHYGHLAGDDCLQQVAGALATDFARAGDFVARYGGEEFVLLLGAAALPGAAARVLSCVAELHLAHARAASGTVSVSAGALAVEPGATELEPRAVLARVDELLYRAKNEGRNRCVISVASTETVLVGC